MNPRETPLIALVAAVFSIVTCQILARAVGHRVQLSSAQVSAGLTICLAGVVVGLLLVLCVSALRDARSVWERALGGVGLALGCALLLALMGRHLPRVDAAAAAAREAASVRWMVASHDPPARGADSSR
jgi:hypothetical protein